MGLGHKVSVTQPQRLRLPANSRRPDSLKAETSLLAEESYGVLYSARPSHAEKTYLC